MTEPAVEVEELFRRESGRLIAALTRVLGPSNVALAEDAVQDALVRAMQAWPYGQPNDPKAWILKSAKNRAIDILRRERRLVELPQELDSEWTPSPADDSTNQLEMMFSICDDTLAQETHVTLILRLLCGLSAAEIARAFLVDTQTVDRRLSRGRTRLQELGKLHDVSNPDQVLRRQPSVLQALYLLFSEGYHGSDPDNPLHPAMCEDALRLAELLLESNATDHVSAHAMAALFCFDAARLATRVDDDGELVELARQDRTRWDHALIGRGVVHLARAATGAHATRWHFEAGIACEHAIAPSVEGTDWKRIVELYDGLFALAPGPIVVLNRALAVAELRGPEPAREALRAVADDPRLVRYSFFWGALADLERRAGNAAEARSLVARAISLARSAAERTAYERKLQHLL